MNARRAWILVVVLGMLPVGCVAPQVEKSLKEAIVSDGITAEREQRTEEVNRQFHAEQSEAQLQAARAQYDRQDYLGCKKSLKRLLERQPDHRRAQLLLVEVLVDLGRAEEAMAYTKSLVQANPTDAAAHYSMGLIFDAMGQSKNALAHYDRALSEEPSNELYQVAYHSAAGGANHQAVLATASCSLNHSGPADRKDRSHDGNYSGCNSSYSDNHGLENSAANARFDEGLLALTEGAADAAVAHFREAAQLGPNHREILILAAVEALRLNQPTMVVKLLSPESSHPDTPAAWFRLLGVAQYRLGDFRSSEISLSKALSLDSSNALTYYLLGCTLAKLGKNESADAHLEPRESTRPEIRFAALAVCEAAKACRTILLRHYPHQAIPKASLRRLASEKQ